MFCHLLTLVEIRDSTVIKDLRMGNTWEEAEVAALNNLVDAQFSIFSYKEKNFFIKTYVESRKTS